MATDLLLPLALVLITGYYALQTRKTVNVMEESIRAQQHPRLVMQVGRVGDFWAGVWIKNEGQGPAIDAFLQIFYVPPPGTNRWTFEQQARVSVISGDLQVQVDGPKRKDEVINFDTLCRDYDTIRLEGEFTDSLGERHQVRQELKDLRAFARHSDVGFKIENDRLLTEATRIGHTLARTSGELRLLREGLVPEEGGDEPEDPPASSDDDLPF